MLRRSRSIQPYLGLSSLKKNSPRSRLNPAIALVTHLKSEILRFEIPEGTLGNQEEAWGAFGRQKQKVRGEAPGEPSGEPWGTNKVIKACTRPDKAKQASKKMRKQALLTSLPHVSSLRSMWLNHVPFPFEFPDPWGPHATAKTPIGVPSCSFAADLALIKPRLTTAQSAAIKVNQGNQRLFKVKQGLAKNTQSSLDIKPSPFAAAACPQDSWLWGNILKQTNPSIHQSIIHYQSINPSIHQSINPVGSILLV